MNGGAIEVPDRVAVADMNEDRTAMAEVVELGRQAGGPDAWTGYFANHARTFRMAARLFPAAHVRLVSGVYAFCRFTDDLVDEPGQGATESRVQARLRAWKELAARSFQGETVGVPILDEVLGEASCRGVSWDYPAALLEGMSMDLTLTRYPDWDTLERYTFCVAGSVGGWLTQLFGLLDSALLQRAHALGRGMQLTNIVRDVGEDWTRGRVYVPESLLASHGLEADDVGRLLDAPRPLPSAWVAVVESMMAAADARYRQAWPGIRRLPGHFRRPVAAATAAYRGIHREVRRNGHDNLARRAHTNRLTKLVLAAGGLLRARL